MGYPLGNIPEDCVYNFFPSPVGQLAVVVSDRGVHAIFWATFRDDKKSTNRFSGLNRSEDHPLWIGAAEQLQEYFSGARKTFDLPLVLNGTQFQNAVWNSLRNIPYGQTVSYEEQAIRLGGKEKVRAVGRANGMNPIPILIPCHRVIGKNGSLTGFGGGLTIKAFLLDLEAARSKPNQGEGRCRPI
jgi:methylated-DNA-[protein]-cysteine S-methyltransferase